MNGCAYPEPQETILKILPSHLRAIYGSVLREQFIATLKASGLERLGFLNVDVERMAPDDIDDVHDVCIDFLTNEAPVVEEYTAEQDKGSYGIFIKGVPGAYFVDADDRSPEGLFGSLQDARSWLLFNYGEFLLK